MRKSISILFCLSLISWLSLNLYSQTAENELDQAELLKQFIGYENQMQARSFVKWTGNKKPLLLKFNKVSDLYVFLIVTWIISGLTYAETFPAIKISSPVLVFSSKFQNQLRFINSNSTLWELLNLEWKLFGVYYRLQY